MLHDTLLLPRPPFRIELCVLPCLFLMLLVQHEVCTQCFAFILEAQSAHKHRRVELFLMSLMSGGLVFSNVSSETPQTWT